MAYACIACPYPWNIPENFWSLPEEERAFYMHIWTMDGNFKSEHFLSRRPGNNVQMLPGTGFFPDPAEFAEKTREGITDDDLPKELVSGLVA